MEFTAFNVVMNIGIDPPRERIEFFYSACRGLQLEKFIDFDATQKSNAC